MAAAEGSHLDFTQGLSEKLARLGRPHSAGESHVGSQDHPIDRIGGRLPPSREQA